MPYLDQVIMAFLGLVILAVLMSKIVTKRKNNRPDPLS